MGCFGWISFTTDYGLSDCFVATCRGTIARAAPSVQVIDITHLISPGDIPRGAMLLAQSVPHLPPAVHLAVVDPGVGTSRRGIAIETPGGLLVGPDNGLLIPAAEVLGGITRVVALTERSWFAAEVSATFHGRDIFAPVAARLALGADLSEAGPSLDPESLIRLPRPLVSSGEGFVDAEVISVDRFGNVQLAARAEHIDHLGDQLVVAGSRAVRASSFGQVPTGKLIAFVDSADYIALAINGGRAVVILSVLPGDMVRITSALPG
jgi:S-adenosyl-L-methionine hydrolase (adenosine-forming)